MRITIIHCNDIHRKNIIKGKKLKSITKLLKNESYKINNII